MAETNFAPRLGEIFEIPPQSVQVFTSSGAPSGTAPEGSINVVSNGDFYQVINGSWTYLFSSGGGGGGTTQIATGSSDPVGAPAAGIVLFARTDAVRVLQWNGSAWVVVTSEI